MGDPGNNVLVRAAGDDTLRGEAGSDLVMDTLATAGVVVDLDQRFPEAHGGEGSDSLKSVEDVVGSDYGDTLIGTPGPNLLIGGEGVDKLDGRGGDEVCFGETCAGVRRFPLHRHQSPPLGIRLRLRLRRLTAWYPPRACPGVTGPLRATR